METDVATSGGIRIEQIDDGAIWRVVLATPKANVVDAAKIAALREVFERAREASDLKAILIEGEGPHFSFGASIEEHLPDNVAAMLAGFHGMLLAMLESDVPCLAAVRGQCLGGGLELVTLCHRIYASADARLGQPEIVLGVIAPAGSVALIERVGRGVAEDLLLSGRSLHAEEARALGLVDHVCEDPHAAALDYARTHLAPKSASSLRFASHAARAGFVERFRHEIAHVERLYLERLMATHDAVEGLQAFLAKRPAQWRNA